RGELEPELAQVAPYLVELDADSPFTGRLLTYEVGRHWGILAGSDANFRSLRTHFRNLFIVADQQGKPHYFRYYDPRILSIYLPACNTGELQTLFGPVGAYYAQARGTDTLLRFTLDGARLGQQSLTHSAADAAVAE
ncbi:DUF4123 domain-containing protein, partial [uncultured Thiodictyon sp.]|uniref:DUF4123 domain-containing protein n=1 Tax=uncultured Thiodictyon sp. TaxID=1846217 RepID=UPI0026009A2B